MSVEMFVDVAADVSNGKFPWFRLTGSLVAAILVLKIRDLCTFIFAGGCAIQLYRNQWVRFRHRDFCLMIYLNMRRVFTVRLHQTS